MCDVAENTLAN